MEQKPITLSVKITTDTHVYSLTSPMKFKLIFKKTTSNKKTQIVIKTKSQDQKHDKPDQMHLSGSPGSKERSFSSKQEQDIFEELESILVSFALSSENSIQADNIHQLESSFQAAGPSGTVHGLGPNELGLTVETTTEQEMLQKLTNSANDVVAAETTLQYSLPTHDRSARQKIIKSYFKAIIKSFCDSYVMIDSFMCLVKDHSFHGKPEEKEYFLSLACSHGYFRLVVVLLALKTDVDCRNINDDCTPLMKAASSGFVKIVEVLLEHDAMVNALSSNGKTSLMYACAGGHVDTVKLLLNYGANVQNLNESGYTPLMEAASAGRITVVKILLEHGADINDHCKKTQESALTLACSKGHLEMVRLLLEAGANQEASVDDRGINRDCTPLMEAALSGFVEIVELLLANGAVVNYKTSIGRTPLMNACAGGNVETVKLLLKCGANLNDQTVNGYTPIMEAILNGHVKVVKILQKQGADISKQCKRCLESILLLICSKGHFEMVRILLAAGVQVNKVLPAKEANVKDSGDSIKKNVRIFSPLAEAVSSGRIEMVELLLEYGASVNSSTATGKTPLMIACSRGYVEIVKLLLKHGADVEDLNKNEFIYQMEEVCTGHTTLEKIQHEHGDDVNAKQAH